MMWESTRDLPLPPPTHRKRLKTHCVNGHEFTPENTYVYQQDEHRSTRVCRQCKRDEASRARERHRAELR